MVYLYRLFHASTVARMTHLISTAYQLGWPPKIPVVWMSTYRAAHQMTDELTAVECLASSAQCMYGLVL